MRARVTLTDLEKPFFKNFNFREGSACHSYQVDKNGKQWPIPHRRIEWTEEEYFVRNRQVRERCFEVCNALKLALQLNQEPQNVKYFMGKSKYFWRCHRQEPKLLWP